MKADAPKVPTIRRVLDFMNDYYATKRIPPSIVEIMKGTGLQSTNTVHHHLDQLIELGFVDRIPRTARGNIPTGKKATPTSFTRAGRKRITRKLHPEYINENDPYGGLYDQPNNAGVRRKDKGDKAR